MTSHPLGYTDADVARWVVEPPKSPTRTAFERDRARIVHSSALRRLGGKTQVLGADTGDFVRTRLTHSLEVAQIGRELGKALGCDPDVVDTACLAHDLGHPPFGHNGETALDEVAREIGGFEGNAQTLRLLTRLEPKTFNAAGESVGLNLTRAALDAAIKYPWSEPEAGVRADGTPSRKFGYYADDAPVFTWIRDGIQGRGKSFEAQVMDLADDISYSVHDLEDSVVHENVDLAELRDPGAVADLVTLTCEWYHRTDADVLTEAFGRLQTEDYWVPTYSGSRLNLAQIKNMTSKLIGRFVHSAMVATREAHGDGPQTRHNASVIIPADTLAEIVILKGVAVKYLMAPREQRPEYRHQREILAELTHAIADHADLALEPEFKADWDAAADDGARFRVAVDQVASLTDTSAREAHQKFCR